MGGIVSLPLHILFLVCAPRDLVSFNRHMVSSNKNMVRNVVSLGAVSESLSPAGLKQSHKRNIFRFKALHVV